ncbi:MAG: YggT family protein [Coriobacteriales bacterium]|jgi:YggT family protein
MIVRSILLAACDLYVGIILIYVLMSWIPNMSGWVLDIYRALGRICDPFLDLFKRIIPPIGMVDISPIFAIIAVQLVGRLIAMFITF